MPDDWEVYYIPHQFTGQPVPCRRPVARKEVKNMGVSPLEGTLRQLEAACKVYGVMTTLKAEYSDADREEQKTEIKRLHDQAINEAAEALL